MTLRDMHGQALSTRRAVSAAAYDKALAHFNRLQPASMVVVEQVLADDPSFVSGRLMQAGLVLGTFDALLLGMARESLAAAAASRRAPTPRERSLQAALAPWAAGNMTAANRLLDAT